MAKKEAAPAASEPGTAKPKRGLDSELQTMAKIDRLLADLDPDATKRVIAWLTDRNQRKMYGHAEPSSDPVAAEVAPER